MSSLLTSLSRNPVTSERSPVFAFYPTTAGLVAWPTANTGYFVKVDRMVAPHTFTGIRIGVGSASGNCKVGLYSSDGTTLTQVALSAATAVAGTNVTQDVPFTSVVTATPSATKDYWAFLVLDNGTATILRATISGAAAINLSLLTSGGVASVYTTPPTSQAISGLTGPASGYTPVLQLY